MRRLRTILCLGLLVAVMVMVPLPVQQATGQDGRIPFDWQAPLNPGEMPANRPALPAAVNMPTLPLEEPLIPGTLFFNIESFLEEYSVLNVTFDALEERFFSFNITYRYGIHPVSPNGQYGVYTVPDGSIDVITCGILDLLDMQTVDRFQTSGGCNQNNIKWSPDSTRILFQTTDAQGQPALGIRQNGVTSTIRPTPSTSADLGGEPIDATTFYVPEEWVSNNLFSFEVATRGAVSESLYAEVANPLLAVPAASLEFTDTTRRIILSRPAQRVGEIYRSVVLNDLISGDRFSVAPPGYQARIADVAPNDSAVVYWAETEAPVGTTHPLRLVIYYPDTDEQSVLLRFDGPTDRFLSTRPGVIVWNAEGIYFHIEQQSTAQSPLQTGTYRIQPDGSNLIFITSELLWNSLPEPR